jgi:hypothetical protein
MILLISRNRVKAREDCSKGDEVKVGIEDPGRESGKVKARTLQTKASGTR